MTCVYCEENESDNSEHVFPYGLGGQNIFMDCVCKNCNNSFSAIEGELLQRSIIGLMRNEVGLEGYRKDSDHPASLKRANILFEDANFGIIYEVGQSAGFRPYLRPQIIEVSGKLFLEGATDNDIKKFSRAFVKWRKDNLILVELPLKRESPNAVKVAIENRSHTARPIYVAHARGAILLKRIFPGDRFYDVLGRRLFLDDEGRLFLRSKSMAEGISFILNLLDIVDAKTPVRSFQKNFSTTPRIDVSFSFDARKVERALVKIGLNALFHYYPLPEVGRGCWPQKIL